MNKTLDLDGLKLVAYQYEHMASPDVSFEYSEAASYYGQRDYERSVDLTKQQAEEIIQFLRAAYKL